MEERKEGRGGGTEGGRVGDFVEHGEIQMSRKVVSRLINRKIFISRRQMSLTFLERNQRNYTKK